MELPVRRSRRPATRPPLPPTPPNGRNPDALAIATIVGLLVVGAVALLDLMQDGTIEPNILALFASVFGPLVPALILRSRGK